MVSILHLLMLAVNKPKQRQSQMFGPIRLASVNADIPFAWGESLRLCGWSGSVPTPALSTLLRAKGQIYIFYLYKCQHKYIGMF